MQEDAAQLCYLVAGLMPQPYDPAARLCLLGADHRAAPRSLASIPALQRTEVLEWAKLPGEYPLSTVITESTFQHASVGHRGLGSHQISYLLRNIGPHPMSIIKKHAVRSFPCAIPACAPLGPPNMYVESPSGLVCITAAASFFDVLQHAVSQLFQSYQSKAWE